MSGHHFHIEILAPNGLKGVEPHLRGCTFPLEAKTSGFNGKVVLQLASGEHDALDFDMPTSTTQTMNASGEIRHDAPTAWAMLLSLSQALAAAGFAHFIGLDVGARMQSVSFRCDLWSSRRWTA